MERLSPVAASDHIAPRARGEVATDELPLPWTKLGCLVQKNEYVDHKKGSKLLPKWSELPASLIKEAMKKFEEAVITMKKKEGVGPDCTL